MERISICRVCNAGPLKPFFNLGEQPLANSLLDRADEPERTYSLSLSFCPACSLVQLNETVPPGELFTHYVWVTGTSKVAQAYAHEFAEELLKRTPDAKRGYVLEVASNDGTFLLPFKEKGYEVLGVDPAKNIVDMAVAGGIPTECFFWGNATAKELVARRGKARIIFARNVLPHVANTRDFVEGLALAVQDDGVIAIEAHYAKVILEGLHYDSIYHEHLCYFTLKSLERLVNDFGLFVFDIRPSPISGGSMVVYLKKTKTSASAEVERYRAAEREEKINEFSNWQEFARASFAHRDKLLALLKQSDPKDLIGWGASARSSTMLNFCRLTPALVPAVIDLNPLKQGKFTAGTHIPIVGAEEGMKRNPKTVFIMAWNFADEIMDILRKKFSFRGTCIVPLPNTPRTVKM